MKRTTSAPAALPPRQAARVLRTRAEVDETERVLERMALEFSKRERAEAGFLIRARGYALVHRPGYLAPRRVSSLREWDELTGSSAD